MESDGEDAEERVFREAAERVLRLSEKAKTSPDVDLGEEILAALSDFMVLFENWRRRLGHDDVEIRTTEEWIEHWKTLQPVAGGPGE